MQSTQHAPPAPGDGSEAAYRAIFDASHDGILVQDPATGAVVDANRRVCDLHGVTVAELRARGLDAIGDEVPPYTADVAIAHVAAAARGEAPRFEWCTRHRATGELMWVEVGLQRVTIGGADRILAHVRDIRDRKRAEEALRATNEALERRVAERTAELAVANEALAASADRFRRLIENGNDLLMISGPDLGLTYVSPSVERLLGYTPEEMLAKRPEDVLHPDDVAPVLAIMRDIIDTPGTVRRIAWRIRHKDGRWRLIDAIGRTISPDTAADGVVCNGRDITEQREAERALQRSEEHFRALIEHSYDLVQVLDAAGHVVYTGPSVQRLLGYTAEEIAGGTLADFMHPDDLPAASALVGRVLASPGTAESLQYRVRHKDGSWRWLEAWARTLSPTTAAEGIVANARDMTDRVRGEEALRRATAEAEQARADAERANVAKSEFLSRMSHELRTPMNSILGFAQLLAETAQSAADQGAVRHILKAGEHLLALINEVLDISRIEAGRQELSLEPVKLGLVLHEAMALVRPIAAARGVWVAEGMGAAGDAWARADRQRLAQVLLNLLSNAVKYNRPGGTVRVTSEVVAGAGASSRLVVRIEDTGRGIPAERQDQLFTPFARLGAEQSEVEGTGLGLALSRRLVHAMGGELELEASGPEGSVFRVTLDAAPAPAPAASLPIAARTPSLDARATVKLVYVEDNLANLSLVEAVLAPYPGWMLLPALQGQLGVELAQEHLPDLVLLDLHLPDMHGEEVLRRLRADGRTAAIPVVVISADATAASVKRLTDAGADAYLTKPLNVRSFTGTLERLLAAEPRG